MCRICHVPLPTITCRPDKIVSDGFYFLLMADLRDTFYQEATLTKKQAVTLLEALARFHAHFWKERTDDGEGNSTREQDRGGFWTMHRRKTLNGEHDHDDVK